MKPTKESEIDFAEIENLELLDYIAMKEDFPEEATQAFVEFCSRFERDILQKAEVYCSKYNYNEVTALRVANCTFRRVWKYPTFKKEKAKSTNSEKAILLWMYPIIFRQVVKFGGENKCEEEEEEDLEIIESVDQLIESYSITDVENKRELKAKLDTIERTLKGLSDKHQIIYLTYTAYNRDNKKLPRKLLEKLRSSLDLTQKSINTYKNQAEKHIQHYLNFINNG
jgi:hypothetical protein